MMRSPTARTAPMGTSPAAAPSFACSNAACMNSSCMVVLAKEELVCRIVVLRRVRVCELVEECAEGGEILVGNFESREHATEVGAMVTVMEQADVPASTELLEKLRER